MTRHPTAERVRERLSYDRETGCFTWLAWSDGPPFWNPKYAGKRAGHQQKNGYRVLAIDGKLYPEHRLAWLYETGEWPTCAIDHRDKVPYHNWFANLRLATKAQNGANQKIRKSNTSGVKGASLRRDTGRWLAQIRIRGRVTHLGIYDTKEIAGAAYAAAAAEHFGEFARTS
jgi:hypothetical protein